MKRAFFNELEQLGYSFSKERKNELYDDWKWLQKHYVIRAHDDYQSEWLEVLKKYFLETITNDPYASRRTYFEAIYGILSSENLWFEHEEQLTSESYSEAYQLMKINHDLVVSEKLETPTVMEYYCSHAKELYIEFMVEEMLGAYPEYQFYQKQIFDDLSFLLHYYPELPHDCFYDNISFEIKKKQLPQNERRSYLFGMCHHDFVRFSMPSQQPFSADDLKNEVEIYYDWIAHHYRGDMLLNDIVEKGMEDQMKRLVTTTRTIKHIVKE